MGNRKNSQSTNITGKIRSSLVIKLNMRMIQRLFSGFLTINILIFLMGSFVILWKAEERLQGVIETMGQSPRDVDAIYPADGSYKILMTNEPLKGIMLPQNIQKNLPIEISDASRSIRFSRTPKEMKLFEKIGTAEYIIGFSVGDSFYQIEYLLGSDLRLFLTLFSIMLVFQLLIIIGDIGKGSRTIRKTLKPLADLTETARTLNKEMSSMAPKIDDDISKI